MARSVAQITQSITTSLAGINPSLDLVVGPTYDYLLAPIPQELALVEQKIDDLLNFYSADLPSIATPQQAQDFATNFGIQVSLGESATGSCTFFRYSPPPAGATLIIPVGLLVGTIDGQYLFATLESVNMLGDSASTYYNPQTSRYEISCIVQATAPGAVYNLPPQRITRIVTANSDFDGIYQPAAMAGGTEPETSADLATRVIAQFKGINLNSVTGLATLASRFIPTGILASAVIRPTDRFEFRRLASGPAIDLCINGQDIQSFTEEYFAIGGETLLTLQTETAQTISTVSINNTALDPTFWTFLPDTSLAYQGSTRAQNVIQLDNPLTANDIVDISGSQNSILDQIQSVVAPGDDAIFATDVLVRSFVNLPVTVSLNLKIQNSPLINIADVQLALEPIVANYIQPGTSIPASLDADDLSNAIYSAVQYVDSLEIVEFRRTYLSVTDVETVIPLKNQIPVLDTNSSSLVVRI